MIFLECVGSRASLSAYYSKFGEMLEWLKRHAWKACIPLKGIGGSNPPLSAETFLYSY